MKVFVIADTHFDHANIIKYCNRPFASVQEMNKVMLKNWNNTVMTQSTLTMKPVAASLWSESTIPHTCYSTQRHQERMMLHEKCKCRDYDGLAGLRQDTLHEIP